MLLLLLFASICSAIFLPHVQRECTQPGDQYDFPEFFNEQYGFSSTWHFFAGKLIPKDKDVVPLSVQATLQRLYVHGVEEQYLCFLTVTDPNRNGSHETQTYYQRSTVYAPDMLFQWANETANTRLSLRWPGTGQVGTPIYVCAFDSVPKTPQPGEKDAMFRLRIRLLSDVKTTPSDPSPHALELALTMRATKAMIPVGDANGFVRVAKLNCSTSIYYNYPEMRLDKVRDSGLKSLLPLVANVDNCQFANRYNKRTFEDGAVLCGKKPHLHPKPENYVTVGGRTYELQDSQIWYDRQATSQGGLENYNRGKILKGIAATSTNPLVLGYLYPFTPMIAPDQVVVNNNYWEAVRLADVEQGIVSVSSHNGWVFVLVAFPELSLFGMFGLMREYNEFRPGRASLEEYTHTFGYVTMKKSRTHRFGPEHTFVLERKRPLSSFAGFSGAVRIHVSDLNLEIECELISDTQGKRLPQVHYTPFTSVFTHPFGAHEALTNCTAIYESRVVQGDGWLEEILSTLY